MTKYCIYSLEDDDDIAKIIKLALSKQDYDVSSFSTGHDFFKAFQEKKPNLVLLDLMLPDMPGEDIIQQIRKDHSNDDVEIMVLSAKSQIVDKVNNLDLGADDYLEKPFDILELISRVNAKYRRQKAHSIIQIGKTMIDYNRRLCEVDGKEILLTNAEFTILFELMKNSDNVVSRDDLLSVLWGDRQAYETRTIDVHVKSLRTKLGEEGKHILTVYGVGYRFLK